MFQIISAIVIMLVMIAAFATQCIPAPVTAVLASLGMMLCGIISPSEAISSFGSDAVIMVVGVMILGNAVFETGLAEKIGRGILRFEPAARTEKRFLIVILVIVAALSAFMSNTAAVAMFIPLVSSVARASKGKIKKKNVFMAMGVVSILGGNCTLAGSTPQLTAQGILQSTPGAQPLTFFQLAYIALPLVGVTLIYYMTLGYKLQERCFDFPENDTDSGEAQVAVEQNNRQQIIVAVILLACVAGFVSGWFSLGTIALLSGCLCIMTGCISCQRAFQMMDWSTIAILGGALGFSKGLNQSGAVDFIANYLLKLMGGPKASPILISAVLILLASVLGNLMSHTATVAVLTPIGISLATAISVSPIAYVVGIIIGSNLAFATPIATPPLTMTLVAGYRFTDYTKVGGLLNLILLLLTIVLVPMIYLH